MGRPKAADPQATQAALLDAAENAFAELGFAGARMTAISKAAGVTHAMLHYYFEDKETLYAKVIDRLFGRHLALLMQRVSPPVSHARFREIALESFDLFWRHPNQVRIMLWELAAGDDRVERIARPLFDMLTSALPELNPNAPANTCAEHDPRDVFASLLGAMVVYFFRDPSIKQLYGDERFTEADHARRRAHIGALIDLFF